MSIEQMILIFASIVAAATPLAFAAFGELVTERAGVLNLGVEGMMLMGAVAGFAVASQSGSLTLGFGAGLLAGLAMSLIFAVLTLHLQTNQVATGLALTLFGAGLSAFIGKSYVGLSLQGLQPISIPYLTDIPLIGRLIFHFDWVVYGSFVLLFGLIWFFKYSRWGLVVRAVGESPVSAHAIGYPVIRIRYLAILFGGAMSGIAGAYLSLAITPMWVEGMTSGRGWIALALVVFATWKPVRVMVGAYLFGGVTILQFYGQGMGVHIPSEILSMLPYLVTIVVLVLISRNPKTILLNQPMSLGQSFYPRT
ncbi:MAG TPA: ABC transporter permease [Halothiobacillus sp.]|nr:MAG: ABC transporter permease [Halothiobacillus sp. 20-54-6]HQT43422.1 ABC transporter permease [Halothiobacillus sp.]